MPSEANLRRVAGNSTEIHEAVFFLGVDYRFFSTASLFSSVVMAASNLRSAA